MFFKIDTSRDGFLNLQELQNGMEEVLGPIKSSSTDWNQILEQLDTN